MTETTWMQRGAAGAAIEGPLANAETFLQREGLLHILWMNRQAHNATPLYHVGFAAYQGGRPRMTIIRGGEHLRSFLDVEIGASLEVIDSVCATLKRESVANIVNVALSDDKLARLGLL